MRRLAPTLTSPSPVRGDFSFDSQDNLDTRHLTSANYMDFGEGRNDGWVAIQEKTRRVSDGSLWFLLTGGSGSTGRRTWV